ncbi:YihY/virulence factor BrkB family protein [Devosia nitrariae]|uniref:YihY/virulence factor BrkB family protein n=1 Tax=Devosia nitrariae TaxID=2071872 RepID=A0ABQ5VZP2_9HYPH|nr:YihY/virulence factor BrkB family protein [Devosia nitrariae]GLQ53106.1 hypothetical protein GCM10010862_03640 [Devosia nitrariae]
MADDIDILRANEPGRGRDAERPRQIPPTGWKDVAWRVFNRILENRVMLTAAGVTYFTLLAIAPSLTCFVVLYGLFNSPVMVVDQLDLLAGILPSGGLEVLRDQLVRLTSEDNRTLSLTLVVSLAIAVWSAGAGFRALFEAMNVAYNESEKRHFLMVNLLALVFTIAGTIAAMVAIATVIVIPTLLSFLPIEGRFDWLVRVSSYAVMLAILIVGVAALYRLGPSREDAKWRWIAPGNVFAVIGVVLTSLIFSWYASNFSDYNATYGSLGALVGFLTWIWLSVTVVIIGAVLNAEVEHQTARDTTTGEEQPLGHRGAYVADTVGRAWPKAKARTRNAHAPSLGGLVLLVPLALLVATLSQSRRR